MLAQQKRSTMAIKLSLLVEGERWRTMDRWCEWLCVNCEMWMQSTAMTHRSVIASRKRLLAEEQRIEAILWNWLLGDCSPRRLQWIEDSFLLFVLFLRVLLLLLLLPPLLLPLCLWNIREFFEHCVGRSPRPRSTTRRFDHLIDTYLMMHWTSPQID